MTHGSTGTGKPLRVAMLANLFRPVVSGSSTQVEGLARALTLQGHHCVVITAHVDPNTPSREVIDGFEVHRIPALHLPKMEISLSFPWLNWVLWPKNLRLIENLLKEHRIEVLHVHNHMFDMAFVGAILRRRLHLPMILTMHTVIKHANAGYNAILKFFDRVLLGSLEPVPKGLSDWGTRDSKGLFRPSWSERCGPQPLAGSIVARDFDMKRI